MIIQVLTLTAVVSSSLSTQTPTPDAAEQVASQVLEPIAAREPTIEEVQKAAARSSPELDRLESLAARARLAAWLPKITAGYRHDERSTRVVCLESNGSEVDYLRLVPGDTIEVRASWNFDELLFTQAELHISSALAQLTRQRDERVEKARRIYFERRKRTVELALAPPLSAQERAEEQLEIDALTAELDALTGGLLSRRRTP